MSSLAEAEKWDYKKKKKRTGSAPGLGSGSLRSTPYSVHLNLLFPLPSASAYNLALELDMFSVRHRFTTYHL
ncbi:unnamed protein product [Penicillium camemberti]|uniref:Str. FM013 n=1 Tax=Penicillium camemberti (strain FM 013) TaxID=1429867 RepID=A0A0G4NSU6_PENC3|nr:unnamed protein product [Penicillium camemberti]